MVHNKIIHVDVAFLTYNPKRSADMPSVKQDSSCIVGLEHLRTHHEIKRREKNVMGQDAYHHYKWYNSMLAYELKTNPENLKLKIVHWHIESANTDAFLMNGKIYKSVSIIIGESLEHWYCWNRAGDKSYGSRYRKSNESQGKTDNKLAIFTIDDNEATFLTRDDTLSKCTTEFCANNCLECKKFKSPFKNSNKGCCACFPSSIEFKSIESDFDDESDDDDDDDDIAQITQLPEFFKRKSFLNNAQIKLNPIHEE
ncbi:hypothetical protein PVAND_009665 [Polypedilum vanderplanki]|uniref:Uncharacterized protein n=1 Tax=Polypedilum vanderplanki TaxID=319348 RepID=A0A9J6CDG0_POLVA|nr:hypothetical protein PVAND_009665 [Polypedilum vanderplanki]